MKLKNILFTTLILTSAALTSSVFINNSTNINEQQSTVVNESKAKDDRELTVLKPGETATINNGEFTYESANIVEAEEDAFKFEVVLYSEKTYTDLTTGGVLSGGSSDINFYFHLDDGSSEVANQTFRPTESMDGGKLSSYTDPNFSSGEFGEVHISSTSAKKVKWTAEVDSSGVSKIPYSKGETVNDASLVLRKGINAQLMLPTFTVGGDVTPPPAADPTINSFSATETADKTDTTVSYKVSDPSKKVKNIKIVNSDTGDLIKDFGTTLEVKNSSLGTHFVGDLKIIVTWDKSGSTETIERVTTVDLILAEPQPIDESNFYAYVGQAEFSWDGTTETFPSITFIFEDPGGPEYEKTEWQMVSDGENYYKKSESAYVESENIYYGNGTQADNQFEKKWVHTTPQNEDKLDQFVNLNGESPDPTKEYIYFTHSLDEAGGAYRYRMVIRDNSSEGVRYTDWIKFNGSEWVSEGPSVTLEATAIDYRTVNIKWVVDKKDFTIENITIKNKTDGSTVYEGMDLTGETTVDVGGPGTYEFEISVKFDGSEFQIRTATVETANDLALNPLVTANVDSIGQDTADISYTITAPTGTEGIDDTIINKATISGPGTFSGEGVEIIDGNNELKADGNKHTINVSDLTAETDYTWNILTNSNSGTNPVLDTPLSSTTSAYTPAEAPSVTFVKNDSMTTQTSIGLDYTITNNVQTNTQRGSSVTGLTLEGKLSDGTSEVTNPVWDLTEGTHSVSIDGLEGETVYSDWKVKVDWQDTSSTPLTNSYEVDLGELETDPKDPANAATTTATKPTEDKQTQTTLTYTVNHNNSPTTQTTVVDSVKLTGKDIKGPISLSTTEGEHTEVITGINGSTTYDDWKITTVSNGGANTDVFDVPSFTTADKDKADDPVINSLYAMKYGNTEMNIKYNISAPEGSATQEQTVISSAKLTGPGTFSGDIDSDGELITDGKEHTVKVSGLTAETDYKWDVTILSNGKDNPTLVTSVESKTGNYLDAQKPSVKVNSVNASITEATINYTIDNKEQTADRRGSIVTGITINGFPIDAEIPTIDITEGNHDLVISNLTGGTIYSGATMTVDWEDTNPTPVKGDSFVINLDDIKMQDKNPAQAATVTASAVASGQTTATLNWEVDLHGSNSQLDAKVDSIYINGSDLETDLDLGTTGGSKEITGLNGSTTYSDWVITIVSNGGANTETFSIPAFETNGKDSPLEPVVTFEAKTISQTEIEITYKIESPKENSTTQGTVVDWAYLEGNGTYSGDVESDNSGKPTDNKLIVDGKEHKVTVSNLEGGKDYSYNLWTYSNATETDKPILDTTKATTNPKDIAEDPVTTFSATKTGQTSASLTYKIAEPSGSATQEATEVSSAILKGEGTFSGEIESTTNELIVDGNDHTVNVTDLWGGVDYAWTIDLAANGKNPNISVEAKATTDAKDGALDPIIVSSDITAEPTTASLTYQIDVPEETPTTTGTVVQSAVLTGKGIDTEIELIADGNEHTTDTVTNLISDEEYVWTITIKSNASTTPKLEKDITFNTIAKDAALTPDVSFEYVASREEIELNYSISNIEETDTQLGSTVNGITLIDNKGDAIETSEPLTIEEGEHSTKVTGLEQNTSYGQWIAIFDWENSKKEQQESIVIDLGEVKTSDKDVAKEPTISKLEALNVTTSTADISYEITIPKEDPLTTPTEIQRIYVDVNGTEFESVDLSLNGSISITGLDKGIVNTITLVVESNTADVESELDVETISKTTDEVVMSDISGGVMTFSFTPNYELVDPSIIDVDVWYDADGVTTRTKAKYQSTRSDEIIYAVEGFVEGVTYSNFKASIDGEERMFIKMKDPSNPDSDEMYDIISVNVDSEGNAVIGEGIVLNKPAEPLDPPEPIVSDPEYVNSSWWWILLIILLVIALIGIVPIILLILKKDGNSKGNSSSQVNTN